MYKAVVHGNFTLSYLAEDWTYDVCKVACLISSGDCFL